MDNEGLIKITERIKNTCSQIIIFKPEVMGVK